VVVVVVETTTTTITTKIIDNCQEKKRITVVINVHANSYGRPTSIVDLNCHEPHTKNFKLVGVFKETNGLYDWFEQLFKHEGTCIWNDEDVYDTMTSFTEKWPSQCKKLDVRDDDGNTLYMSTAPLPEGNMTLGIYTDSSCVQLSESIDYTAYIMMMWENYYERSYYYGYGYCE